MSVVEFKQAITNGKVVVIPVIELETRFYHIASHYLVVSPTGSIEQRQLLLVISVVYFNI